MSEETGQAKPEANAESPPPQETAPPAAAQPTSYGNELKRFEEQKTEVPEGLPERFLKDGKPDFNNLTKSYVELDRAYKTKTEDLREQVKKEILGERPEKPEEYKAPEKYDIPDDSPLLGWWREQAHNAGLSQETFEQGLEKYMERAQAIFDPEAEKKKLGDNADARIEAVKTWSEKTFEEEERDVISQIATSAAGIKVLEKMMRGGKPIESGGEDIAVTQTVTLEKLRQMQNDPKYYDPSRRDPEWVKTVEEGYRKLYPE